MKDHSLLRAKLENIHGSMLKAFHDSASYSPSISGFEREIVQKRLLALMLPPHYRVGTGTIIDALGNESGQVDAVIEQPFSLSFPIASEENRLYLASSVCAAFEIKSNLNTQGKDALKKIERIRRLQRIKVAEDTVHSYDDVSIPAFVVGYKGPTSIKKLEEKLVEARNKFTPTGILVIESELFYGRSAGGGWYEATGKAACLFAFLACLLDSVRYAGGNSERLIEYIGLVDSKAT